MPVLNSLHPTTWTAVMLLIPPIVKEHSAISILSTHFSCFATFCENDSHDSCSHWIYPICRGRSHKVYIRAHFQSPLQRLYVGQAGQLRTDTNRDTDLQSSSGVAASLQHGPLSQSTRRLFRTRQKHLDFFKDPDNRASDFEFEFQT